MSAPKLSRSQHLRGYLEDFSRVGRGIGLFLLFGAICAVLGLAAGPVLNVLGGLLILGSLPWMFYVMFNRWSTTGVRDRLNALGATCQNDARRVWGSWEGVPFEVRNDWDGAGGRTLVQTTPTLSTDVRIARPGVRDVVGGSDVEVGSYDRALHVEGDPAEARCLLDGERAKQVARQLTTHGDLRFEDGRVRVEIPGTLHDAKRVVQAVREVVELGRALRLDGERDMDTRLLETAQSGSPELRVQSMQRLRRRSPDDARLPALIDALLTDADESVRLDAAVAVGRMDVVRELAAAGRAARAGAVASLDGDPESLRIAAEALRDPDASVRLAAIAALERYGGDDELNLLRDVAAGDVENVAERARRAIVVASTRLGELNRGGAVSVVDVASEAGGLSEAEATGALSEAVEVREAQAEVAKREVVRVEEEFDP